MTTLIFTELLTSSDFLYARYLTKKTKLLLFRMGVGTTLVENLNSYRYLFFVFLSRVILNGFFFIFTFAQNQGFMNPEWRFFNLLLL